MTIYRAFVMTLCLLCAGALWSPQSAWCEEPKFEWLVDPELKVVWGRLGWLDDDRVVFIGEETEGKSLTGNHLRLWNMRTGSVTDHLTDVASLCVSGPNIAFFRIPRRLPDYWPMSLMVPFWIDGGWHRGAFPDPGRIDLPNDIVELARCVARDECPPGMDGKKAFQGLDFVIVDYFNCRIRKVDKGSLSPIPLRDGDGELLTTLVPGESPKRIDKFRFLRDGATDAIEIPFPAGLDPFEVDYFAFKGAYFLYQSQDFELAESDPDQIPQPWPAWWLWPDGRIDRFDVPRGLTGPAFPSKLGLLQVHYDQSKTEDDEGIFLFLPKGPVRVSRTVYRGIDGPPAVSPSGCKAAFSSWGDLLVLDLCGYQEAIEQLSVYRFKNLEGPTYRIPIEKP